MKKYKVTLTRQEVERLKSITQKGRKNARVIKNALVLLNVDEGTYGKSKKDENVADFLELTVRTIENVRKRFVTGSFEQALNGRPSEREYKTSVDGDAEAHLVAISCSEPPEGFGRWSLRLLADRMVALNYIDSISHETVRRVLKKTS